MKSSLPLAVLLVACGSSTSAVPASDAGMLDGAGPVDGAADVADAADASSPTVAACAGGVGPMPTDPSDVSYSWPANASQACGNKTFCDTPCSTNEALLSGLLACAPVEGGYAWTLGSSYIRVLGISGGACVYGITIAIELGAKLSQCTTPLPVQAWKGLELVSSDNGLLPGNLTTGLDCTEVDAGSAPVCPPAPPPAGCE